MIVSREWLKACIIDSSKIEEDRLYAVRKVQWLDGPVFENKIGEWKKQIAKMVGEALFLGNFSFNIHKKLKFDKLKKKILDFRKLIFQFLEKLIFKA